MATLNRAIPARYGRTHEGAPAAKATASQQLRRAVLCCLLWEDSFYEDGQSIADRIATLAREVREEEVASLAIEARDAMKLRHAPLWLVCALLERRAKNVAALIPQVVQRPDEMTELLAMYWKDGKRPLAAQLKRGLAVVFRAFSAYQLAKYDRPGAVRLRDVLFLVHAEPKDEEQAATWRKLVDGTLESPDTWEVALSSGADKRETWARLLTERKLGALALVRNLRNMQQAGIPDADIAAALDEMKVERVLPFRFVAAARHAPTLEPALERAMYRCLEGQPKLPGKTALLVDGSGSMFGTKISEKSELDRFDAAAALAILAREMCEDIDVICFSNGARLLAPRRGFALRDLLYAAAERQGTYTEVAKQAADSRGYDRIIILTDEQSHTALTPPKGKGYVLNVASYQNGIGHGAWETVTGWSESVLHYIASTEES